MNRAEFLKTYQKYQLGDLVTERPHPDTRGLSELVQKDVDKALSLLQAVDIKALKQFSNYTESIEVLRQACKETLDSGGRIFLCGCGATGRLSLTIEFLFREKYQTDQVISFMAGGDIALVHSLEGFEDYPEYGKRHLLQLGFKDNDLLIGTTEGGETPYVIGAVEASLEVSTREPFMLYCNPDEVLVEKVERSKRVIENKKIHTLCFDVGPMALSGSTRMQSSTVLQLALGLALVETAEPVSQLIEKFIDQVSQIDFKSMAELIQKEAFIYQQSEYVMYVPRKMAITVFTDTTERSPTFNLPPFEGNHYKGESPSLCYILIPQAENPKSAWSELLGHEPRPVDWPEVDGQTSAEYLAQFDFSKNSLESREERVGDIRQYLFEIDYKDNKLLMSLGGVEKEFEFQESSELFKHTALKMLLNAHSTLMMGLMGRYQSNIMTWVTATNGKLVDRASRYVQILLQEQNVSKDYLEVVNCVFDLKNEVKPDECIVLKVMDALQK